MLHFETARDCPKCGVLCMMTDELNRGERINTCPACRFEFVDMSEQFADTYYGIVYDPSDGEIMPPSVLFASRKECEEYFKVLKLKDDDGVVSRCSIYGVFWSGAFMGDDPWKDTFQPFIPDTLPANVTRTLEIAIPNAAARGQEFHMQVVGDFNGDQIYFCRQTQRYYLFVLFPFKVGPPIPRPISVPTLPAEGWRPFLYATWVGIRETEASCGEGIREIKFLTWEEFVYAGGKIRTDIATN